MARDIPTRIKMPDGTVYRLCLLRVESVREDKPKIGDSLKPWELSLVDDDDTVEVGQNCRFITAYLPESQVGERPIRESR